MRTIIAGSRTTTTRQVLDAMESCPWKPSVVISGTARGADWGGEEWAMMNSISVERFPADWGQYGKRAGFIRNEQMAKVADALVLVWDGQSRGSASMKSIAQSMGLRIHEVVV